MSLLGDGPDKENILQAVKERDFKERVKFLGYQSG